MTTERFEVQDRPQESRYVLIDHEAIEAEQIIGEEEYVEHVRAVAARH